MVYFGKVRHGKIETDPGIRLPEGEIVRIEPVNGAAPAPDGSDPLDRIAELVVHDDLPADMAREHDHYIYGMPKRGSR